MPFFRKEKNNSYVEAVTPEKDSTRATIKGIYVDTNNRKQRLGTELLGMIENDLANSGVTSVSAAVGPYKEDDSDIPITEDELLGFYERNGYKYTGESDDDGFPIVSKDL